MTRDATTGMQMSGSRIQPDLDVVIALLADEARLGILIHLANGHPSVSNLADELELDISSTSRKLRQLLRAGLVEYSSKRFERFYRLSRYVQLQTSQESDKLEVRITNQEGEFLFLCRRLSSLTFR